MGPKSIIALQFLSTHSADTEGDTESTGVWPIVDDYDRVHPGKVCVHLIRAVKTWFPPLGTVFIQEGTLALYMSRSYWT